MREPQGDHTDLPGLPRALPPGRAGAKRLSPLDDVLSTATHFVLRTYKKEGRFYQDDEIDERECTVL